MTLSALCFSARIDWTAVHGPVDAELEATLDRARKLNRLNGVTGALLLSQDMIVTWIEGEPRGLADTRECVTHDPRLRDVTMLAAGPINERLFARCWLYLADLREDRDADTTGMLRDLASGNLDIKAAAKAISPLTTRLAAARQTQRAMLV